MTRSGGRGLSREGRDQPPLHRRVQPVHLRPSHAARARARPCAATRSPRWAWRSRSSRRCSRRGSATGALIVLGIALGTAIGIPARAEREYDRDAADGRAVQRRRRRRRGADRVVEFRQHGRRHGARGADPVLFAAIIGSICFWGSIVAFAKLQELISGPAVQAPGRPADHQRRAPARSPSRCAVDHRRGTDSSCCSG